MRFTWKFLPLMGKRVVYEMLGSKYYATIRTRVLFVEVTRSKPVSYAEFTEALRAWKTPLYRDMSKRS